jgi:uncharacterized protein YlaI
LHPHATLREIEQELDRRLEQLRAKVLADLALDERLARLRARMLTDTTLQSAAADLREQPVARPACPDCGGRLVLAGQEERVVTTTFDQALAVTRSAMVCTACHRRVFPPG